MTVAGTCTDCIINVPNDGPLSLKFKVDIQEGINHLIKHRGQVNGYYPSSELSIQSLQIAPTGSYSPLQSPTSLLVGTDTPVQVTLFRGTISFVLSVNQLLIIDDSFTSMSITNPSATDVANVLLAFTM